MVERMPDAVQISGFHLAGANTSSELHRVDCIIHFADAHVRRFDLPHVTLDRQQIAGGDFIGGGVSPIAWSRREGELPALPSGRPPQVGFR